MIFETWFRVEDRQYRRQQGFSAPLQVFAGGWREELKKCGLKIPLGDTDETGDRSNVLLIYRRRRLYVTQQYALYIASSPSPPAHSNESYHT